MKQHVGHYEIVSELGRGGMGVVYKGYEPALTRYVAIKELSPALSHDPNLVERFLREARAMAALNDPHVLQVYFIGQDEGQPFFAMEFCEGESVAQVIKRQGRLSPADTLRIVLQAAQGLAVAHEHGVIHRDIKPANLMLDLRGRLKVADFGIALAKQEFDSKLTGTGEFVGTPGYLSPEVCLGKPVDARSDLFALGIVMFECLTGRLPFSDESPLKLMLDVVQAEIPDIRGINAEVDADTARLLTRLVAKDPADRFQSAAELAAEVARHPLLAGQGTQLSLTVLRPTTGPAATMIASSAVVADTARRKAAPPPSVSAAGISAPPMPPTPPAPPVVDPPTLARPAAASPAAASPAAPSRAPLLAAIGVGALMVVALAWGAWQWRQSSAGEASGDVVSPNAVVGTTPIQTIPPGAAPVTDATISTTIESTDGTAPVAVAADAPAAVVPPLPEQATDPAPVAASPAMESNLPVAPPAASEPAAAIPPPLPEPRRAERRMGNVLAVVANGDPAITLPVTQFIEEAAAARGWQLAEDAREADRVVRVNLQQTGTQTLSYYGRSSELVVAQLTVRMFGPAGRPLGPGLRSSVQYTPETADAKAEEAIRGRLEGLIGDPSR